MIGTRHTTRHACDSEHLPNCYNPRLDLTACVCGERWWRGQVGTWHSRPLRGTGHYTSAGRYVSGDIEAWDRYFLHAPGCDGDHPHICGGGESMAAAEVFGGAA